jgi:nucleotide-binding universal stress UspA family protein
MQKAFPCVLQQSRRKKRITMVLAVHKLAVFARARENFHTLKMPYAEISTLFIWHNACTCDHVAESTQATEEKAMMRILIGYNGSEASAAALADLNNTGLPPATQVLILSVAEIWAAPRSLDEAARAARQAKEILNRKYPEWSVFTETASGLPAREILARAETFKPDLIVVGEPRQKIVDRNIFLGNTSQTILAEAECPVRIARGPSINGSGPKRIIIGFDGSAGAMNAVETIAAREWDSSPEVRLLAVTDLGVLTAIDQPKTMTNAAAVDLSAASEWSETIARKAVNVLKGAGVKAVVETRLGNAKDAIITEAEDWDADAVYVGPHAAPRSFDRFLLGSVSAAVAARAHCSVEVIRPAAY